MSWNQLLDIAQEARQYRDEELAAGPVACPNDGEPLEEVDGVLHCKFDGWTSAASFSN